MYVYEEVIDSIVQEIKRVTGQEVNASEISEPPDSSMGDFSTNIAFSIAKKQGKDPAKVAQELSEELKPRMVDQVTPQGPYINFKVKKKEYTSRALQEAVQEGYGGRESKEENITIDYSHPNIAKPFHIGHLRSTVIGEAIANLNEKIGYRVIRINHLGDWGTQFGKLITAYKEWGDPKELEETPIEHLNELYVKFHEEEKLNPELSDEARRNFKKLEEGNQEQLELWEKIRELSIEKFKETYKRLGIKFDTYKGESHYARTGESEKMVKEALEKEVAQIDLDGSIVVNLEKHGMTNCLIKKRDGSTLYSTRDLAAAKDRWKEYRFKKNIYVVRSAQTLHFKQIFKTLELLGYTWSNRCIHVPFGSLNMPEGAMSTRKGNIVELEQLLNEAQGRVLKLIEEKNPQLENKGEVADEVGKAAIKFNDLSQNRVKDIEFNWERALNFEGDTGPYLQYSHARATGIIEEVSEEAQGKDPAQELNSKEEQEMIKKISEFPRTLKNSAEKNEPHILAQHLLELTHAFNTFYRKHSVKYAETKELKSAILKLVQAFKNTLAEGLKVLGITPLEEM